MTQFVREMIAYLKARKKILLAPVIFIMILLGVLILAAQGSIVTPFIYAVF